MTKRFFLIAFLANIIANVFATENILYSDSTTITTSDSAIVEKSSALSAWWNSLINGNVDRTFEKKVDMSFAAAPYYSQESSVGIGGQVSALFRLNRNDSVMQPSDFTLTGGISANGTYSMGIQGNVHFTRKKRLNYVMEFRNQQRNFWGIDFQHCDTSQSTAAQFRKVQLVADYQQRFAGNWFWGAALRLRYISAKVDNPEYLHGQSDHGFYAGIGASIVYDSRDFILNPKKGMLFFLRHVYYPSAFGSYHTDVGCTTMQFNAYHKLWKGAIMAYDVFLETNVSDGETPWALREEICYDDRRMRGYYSGSYIDDNQACVQAELRQNIYKRLGAVAWAGCGTLFKYIEDVSAKQILPNYGFGVRFEMKKDTNIRMDFGFGKNAFGVVFNFAEAF